MLGNPNPFASREAEETISVNDETSLMLVEVWRLVVLDRRDHVSATVSDSAFVIRAELWDSGTFNGKVETVEATAHLVEFLTAGLSRLGKCELLLGT